MLNFAELENMIENKVHDALDDEIHTMLDYSLSDKINCIIDEAVENYDFSDWLDDWIDSYLHETIGDKLDDLIEEKVKSYLECVNPEDYGLVIKFGHR